MAERTWMTEMASAARGLSRAPRRAVLPAHSCRGTAPRLRGAAILYLV